MKHVYNALLIAEQAHRGQVRKYSSDPFVLHPIRVAHMVAYAGYDDEAQAAALLHDVPEDTAITLADLARDTRVSPRTLKLVTALTKWWSDHQQDQTVEKAEYYRRILLDPEAIGLKVADRIDNISEMITLWNRDDIKNGTRRWIERYVEKTEVEFAPLVARLHEFSYAPAIVIRDYYKVALTAVKATIAYRKESH